MKAFVVSLRAKVIAATLLGVLVTQLSPAVGQIRGGVQRALGGRGQRNSGGLINRPLSGGGPVKRVLGGNSNADGNGQARPTKSQILERYGASSNGKWNNATGQSSAAQPKPTEAPKPTNTATAKGAAQPTGPAAATRPIEKPPQPAPAGAALPAGAVASGNADLMLESVKFVEPATETAGPAYRVKLRNRGTKAAGKFRVGAFAERRGELSDDAPQTVTEIASLPAGEVSEVTLRLPVAAVKLVSATSGQPVAFDQLVVVVDLDDSVVESEKRNNVVNLARADLEAAK
jgi:hypothetical protein